MSRHREVLIALLLLSILAGGQCDLDIGFIIDSSGVLNPTNTQNWNTMKGFVAAIIDGLPRWCTRMGTIAFSDRIHLTQMLNSYHDPYKARDSLLTEQLPGFTDVVDLSEALYTARSQLFIEAHGDRENAVNVAVVVTHRRSNQNIDMTIPRAYELHQSGTNIISIGITNKTDENELRDISSPNHLVGSDYFMVSAFSGLNDIRVSVIEKIKEYEKTSIQRCGCDEGTHTDKISFQQDLDIVFIIDGSSSITISNGGYNWDRLLTFISDLIDWFPRFSTRVGAVIFSDKARVEFPLNKYSDMCYSKNEIKFALDAGGKTNTSGGLNMARTQLFNMRNGDRENAPNVAIIITDGRADLDEDMTLPMARQLQEHGVRVISIGVTDQINEDELEQISSPPYLRNVSHFTVPYFDDLGGIMDDLLVAIDMVQPTTSTAGRGLGGPYSSGSTAGEVTRTNLVLYVVVPVLGGLLIVAVVLTVGCALHKRRKKVATSKNELLQKNNNYDNHGVASKADIESDTPHDGPVYEEAAPAHIYDDASSTLPHPQQSAKPDEVYSYATGVQSPVYGLDERPEGAFSQVDPDAASQHDTESSHGQKKYPISAQVQKKEPDMYAQVNKMKNKPVNTKKL